MYHINLSPLGYEFSQFKSVTVKFLWASTVTIFSIPRPISLTPQKKTSYSNHIHSARQSKSYSNVKTIQEIESLISHRDLQFLKISMGVIEELKLVAAGGASLPQQVGSTHFRWSGAVNDNLVLFPCHRWVTPTRFHLTHPIDASLVIFGWIMLALVGTLYLMRSRGSFFLHVQRSVLEFNKP